MKLSELIREQRLKDHMTQADLSEKLHVDPKTVSAWECGRISIPDVSLWVPIEEVLGISVLAQLFGTGFVEIPHVIPLGEYREKVKSDLTDTIFFSAEIVDSLVEAHRVSDMECCDYKLLLTREEIEICRYFMGADPSMSIFEAYERFINPRDILARRNKTI